MEAPTVSKPPEKPQGNPSKPRRRSRFAPSVASTEPKPVPSTATALPTKSSPSQASSEEVQHPNAFVAALRTRVTRNRSPPLSSTSDVAAQPPAPKRRRTGRSRFAQAQPTVPKQTLPQRHATSKPAAASVPKLSVDVTAIPVAPVSTLRINRDAQQQRKLASVLKVTPSDLLETDPNLNPYYDSSIALPAKPTRQPRKDLLFIPQGEVIAQAEKRREQAQVQARVADYRGKLVSAAKNESNLPVLPPHVDDLRTSDHLVQVPQWEWWDVPFLAEPNEAASAIDRTVSQQAVEKNRDAMDVELHIELRHDRITHYVHHPPPIEPTKPKKPPPVVPLMLTKKETKKLRRQRRMEAQKEQQEMVAVGLLPPPKPKVKLSNLMRVLANEASADPTKVEAEVREQVEERRRKHEVDNAARKKTKEERREKTRESIAKDKDAGFYAAVFRVSDMRNPQHRFKVDINARQWEMTGTALLFSECNVVVVEGGLKAVRKFKKLMLRRIDWEASIQNRESSTEGTPKDVSDQSAADGQSDKSRPNKRLNTCALVWEGPIPTPAFEGFTTASVRTQRECRYHFRKHGVEHYWDLCAQGTPLGNENLGVRQID